MPGHGMSRQCSCSAGFQLMATLDESPSPAFRTRACECLYQTSFIARLYLQLGDKSCVGMQLGDNPRAVERGASAVLRSEAQYAVSFPSTAHIHRVAELSKRKYLNLACHHRGTTKNEHVRLVNMIQQLILSGKTKACFLFL